MTSPSAIPVRDDLTSRLIQSFKDMISQGVLTPGMRLPAERDLAQRFGVSRSSLRHALKTLDMLGVITQRVGDGTYLNPDPTRILGSPLEFLLLLDGITDLDVSDTRLIVEPELAALAASRATQEQISQLGSLMEQMAAEAGEDRLIELDLAFHETIFQASGNRLAARIFSLIQRALFASIRVTAQHVEWAHTIEFHRPIYQAIHDREPERARAAMIAHLNDSREILARAGALQAKVSDPQHPDVARTRLEQLMQPADHSSARKAKRTVEAEIQT